MATPASGDDQGPTPAALAELAKLEVEGPDLGPPVVPEPRTPPQRRWRFELSADRLVLRGRCVACDGEHVPDAAALERLIRGLQESGWRTAPCTCDCCTVTAAKPARPAASVREPDSPPEPADPSASPET